MDPRPGQKIVIAGGTGLVGTHLVRRLHEAGHHPCILSRSVRSQATEGVTFHPWEELPAALQGAAAVVNLAGEGIVDRPWTPARKEQLRQSRIGTTRRLVEALAATTQGPSVLVNASAIGLYGPTSEALVDENAPAGSGFLADLCQEWEEAARLAEGHGLRVVRLRLGVVLAREGGALPRMALPVRLFAGSRLGSGAQFVSWIHIEDLVRMILAALFAPAWTGAVNATAPQSCTQAELVRAMANRLHRPVWPIPAWITGPALRLALGQRATMLLDSSRVRPAVALHLGFEFRFPTIEQALEDLL